MFSKGFKSVSLSEIRQQYSDADIAQKYLGVKVPCLVCSPFRDDKRPSLSLYYSKSGNLCYKDFATSDGGSLYDFLSRLWNTSMSETISKIASDIGIKDTLVKRRTKSLRKTTKSVLQVKIREWRDYDIEFWAQFGINKDWLKFGDVYPITQMFFTKDGITKIIPADKYAYAYIERKDGIVSIKIYQPFSDTMKWISKHDSSVWDLWTKLPENGERLIITSSRKDALCLWANTGIPSLSLQGEGYVPKEHVVNQLKQRFKNIYVLYDNDFKAVEKGEENHGRVFGKHLSDMFGLIQIEIPEFYRSKDPSDLFRDWGKEVFRTVMQSLIA